MDPLREIIKKIGFPAENFPGYVSNQWKDYMKMKLMRWAFNSRLKILSESPGKHHPAADQGHAGATAVITETGGYPN